MNFGQIEQIFNRAFASAFSRRKFFVLCPVLLACGMVTVFCNALSRGVNDWMWMSLSFLPIFLSTGILLAAGVLVVKMYVYEVKNTRYQIGKLFSSSLQVIMGVSYLCFPLIFCYLILWAVLGVFYLLKQIPALGDALGVLLSFGPYILVLGSIGLAVVSVMMLFFLTPHVALKKSIQMNLAGELTKRFKSSIFANGLFFFIGMFPLALVVSFLSLGASLTGSSYLAAKASLAIGIQSLVMMVPFCMIMTPFVIFFFNFSLESYLLLKKREEKEKAIEEKKEEVCLV